MQPVIVWLRQDFRLSDNPALTCAARSGRPVVPLYLLDDETPGGRQAGGASRWWLHKSLEHLSAEFSKHRVKLILRRGAAKPVIRALAREIDAVGVYWNRCYEPYALRGDAGIVRMLNIERIEAKSFNASLLFEPHAVKNKSGRPFKVFTPFWRNIRAREVSAPLRAPCKLHGFSQHIDSDDLGDWKLLPTKPDWAGGLRKTWKPGEAGGKKRLTSFLRAINSYTKGRDRLDEDGTSRLSPHLHFGEVSARQIWHAVKVHHHTAAADKFLSELAWREFCHHLLFNNPAMPRDPLDKRFSHFPWSRSTKALTAWTKGQTGVPMVDAGMRQLWTTGWMHNRVRMIAASFLIKHLAIRWQKGEEWFWDTLIDADLANNSANWQWVAGCGADAAPFFRIFNPVLQGKKFDPEGGYVRKWVPEIAKLPDKYLHNPWEAPAEVLKKADVILGETYPEPLVDLAKARDHALAAFRALPRSA